MRKVVGILIVVSLIFTIAGCKTGLTVQDNMYDALGGQVLKISDDFEYVGDCDPTVLTTENQGRAQKSSAIKTRGDVFVRVSDGNVKEFVVIQRLMITQNGASWNPGSGTPVDFYGARFKEGFFDTGKGTEATFASYVDYVTSKGYTAENSKFFVRNITRNVGRQSRVSIFYGIGQDAVPEKIQGNWNLTEGFAREHFEKNVTVVQ